MSYIYKNILEGTAWTEIVPLNTITSWKTITIANTGADSVINIYLHRIVETQGQVDTAVEDKKYVLHDTTMTADVTLVLDPSDFGFDNSIYSLRFETTTSADIIIDSEPVTYVDNTETDVTDSYDGGDVITSGPDPEDDDSYPAPPDAILVELLAAEGVPPHWAISYTSDYINQT